MAADQRTERATVVADPATTQIDALQAAVAAGPHLDIPAIAKGLDATVTQLHSGAYRNPDRLPDGQVLVVGGGNSGCQIAAELAATRRVDLAIGQRLPVLPQRVGGRDLFWYDRHRPHACHRQLARGATAPGA